MLSVSINISTLNPNMQAAEPGNGNSIGSIHLGLIDQFHYAALVKKRDAIQADSNSNTDNNLDDKERAEDEAAFEHACKIKGAPFGTALIPENPELGGKIDSVAPGEGQKPMPIPKFEEMCNPEEYPLG